MALGLEDVRVGLWTHPEGHTGVTVVLPPRGALGAAAGRGGAPGTREVAALGAAGQGTQCHGIVLSGGSAFGLAAADGVVRWCAERGIGYEGLTVPVPVVGAAILFDLRDADRPRPDADAGYAACQAATTADPPMGRVGAGAGATVGKVTGLEDAVPGGQGWAVATAGGATVGAVVAVNALGNVLAEDGTVLAGRDVPPEARFPHVPLRPPPAPEQHTVIGCLVTDVQLTKPQAVRAVDLAHTGIARAIDPPHTSFDGDALFLLTTQRVAVDAAVDVVADLGATAVAAAIRAGARAAAAPTTSP